MAVFVSRVYPEASDQKAEVDRGLIALAGTLYNRGEYPAAAKAFRAAAEFGNDGYAQHYLAVLYSAGTGVTQSDLATLYWLDRAVESGAADVALEERDGMIDAYRQTLSPADFRATMGQLAGWCEDGTPDVPVSPACAARWRALAAGI